MGNIQRIQSEDILKLLGDLTRLAILRLLISHPATISQLGEVLDQHPARIRNHLKQLEKAGLVELVSIQTVKNYLEKYYRATAHAFFVNIAILPQPPEHGHLVVLGSDDPALELLARLISQKPDASGLYILPVGSLDGLIFLREKYCQISGCHLFDIESGEYNLPFVRHLFSDQAMVLVTLTQRQQGLLVRKGNPKNLSSLADIARGDVCFVNRKRGTGTRLWLEQHLRRLGIDPRQINGYDNEVATHSDVAEAVFNWKADAGLGIYAASREFDLDFIPLFEEQYDLVMSEEIFNSSMFRPVLELLQSSQFRQEVESLGGYNTARTGEIQRV